MLEPIDSTKLTKEEIANAPFTLEDLSLLRKAIRTKRTGIDFKKYKIAYIEDVKEKKVGRKVIQEKMKIEVQLLRATLSFDGYDPDDEDVEKPQILFLCTTGTMRFYMDEKKLTFKK